MKKKILGLSFVAIGVIITVSAFLLARSAEAQESVDNPVNHSQNNGEAKVMFGLAMASAFYFTEKGYEISPHISLGKTIANSDHTIGGIGYTINKKYKVDIGLLGEGSTKNGYQRSSYYGSISYITNPQWYFLKTQIRPCMGVAYIPNAQLVGETNYHLCFLFERKVFNIDVGHFSSGGLWEENAGIDYIKITAFF